MLNLEVKGNLARLLATENIVVEHRHVDTAMFNIRDRVLTLPMWEKASTNVYDMLVGHEVGHALYTPDKWGDDYGIPQSYLNVCEDARIEKLMKRKFPGLARNFFAGYKDLAEEDFFGIGDRPMDSYTLIDRINIYFKIGLHAGQIITWKDEEKVLVDMVADAETFEETVEAARMILEYTKEKEIDSIPENAEDEEQETTQGGGSITQSESGDESESRSDEESVGSDIQGSETSGKSGSEESETDKAFSEAQKKLTDNSRHDNISYVELPPLDIDTFVVPSQQVKEDCDTFYKEQASVLFEVVDKEYLTFRSEAQREVNYLVKEFEMRKSADQYARASTAKTGILDTQKLHTYKWNEDVFKKINVVPDGKNHGLIFILDWSGSMGNCLMDTVKQLLNLAWFCKKVQIPFDVYAFTNEYWYVRSYDHESRTRPRSPGHHKQVVGYVSLHENFRLLNLVSSNGRNGKDLEAQLKNFWRLASGQRYAGYSNPPGYSLSGTPLNESVVALTAIIPDFQKRNKVQKTNVIILTDGEGQSIHYLTENSYRPSKLGTNHIDRDCVLRDRKTGRVYPRFEGGYYTCDKITQTFLQCVRDRHPDVNLIGIRLLNGRQLHSTYENGETPIPYAEVQKQWKKSKSAELVDFMGYQSLYVMAIDGLADTSEFEVAEDATDRQIGAAFKQSLAKKVVNKKMLTSFASLIS